MSWLYDHTHFKCSDQDKTATFFKENFGAKEVSRWEVNGMPIISLEIGGCVYNFSPKRANETLDSSAGTVRYGVYHIALKAKDLEAEAAKMKARGVKFTQDVKQLNPKTKFAFVEGPDGISIELLQRD
jgi:lactoylglutathione lyase